MGTPEGIEITGPIEDRFDAILTPGALELVGLLHRELNGRRLGLLEARQRRVEEFAAGGTLDFLEETRAVREDDSWRVADPAAAAARRHPRPGAEGDRRGGDLLRLRGHLQHPQPQAGAPARDRKAKNIVATGAELLVTANPGCLMRVTSAIERSGHPMGMAHTVEVLDASIRGTGAGGLLPTSTAAQETKE